MSPVSLSPEELLAVAQELKATLQEAVVRQVTALSDSRVYLALGWRGEEVLLHACCERGEARLSVVDEQPAGAPRPPEWQALLRRELVGGVLCSVDATPERALLTLSFSRSQRAIRLELEMHRHAGSGAGVGRSRSRVFPAAGPCPRRRVADACAPPAYSRSEPPLANRLVSALVARRGAAVRAARQAHQLSWRFRTALTSDG